MLSGMICSTWSQENKIPQTEQWHEYNTCWMLRLQKQMGHNSEEEKPCEELGGANRHKSIT